MGLRERWQPRPTTPPGRWWPWRERWLDPLWHVAMAGLLPGAWVPPIWSLLAMRRAPARASTPLLPLEGSESPRG